MKNLIKRIDLLLLIFITFILLTAIYWLHLKHVIGNDSTISEWIINYQGGFTRRGIIGEICFQIADFFDLNLRFVIFLFQSFLYTIYSILIYFFLKDVSKNALTIIAIFSPIFLLYPVAEIEVLARKEIFLYVGFIIFLNLSNTRYSKNIPLIYIFFVFPILCLIWEPFIFFFTFAAFVILIRNNGDSLKKITLKIFIGFSSSIITMLIILLNLLTSNEHLLMKNSLMNKFGEKCYMSCALLNDKSSIIDQFAGVFELLSFNVIFRYLVIIIIGFSPLFFLIFNSRLKNKLIFTYLHKSRAINLDLFLIFIFLLLPSILLFASMTDWGRVVNMTYVFSILTYIYLLKNRLLFVNKKIIVFDNFYNSRKKIFIILFIIFAFGWNQKTGMTGDVATNSLYKVVYNTSKRIFNFGSIRLFQDSPVIKFHQKYVE
tara:strand:- start:59 stop:1351 length:1293 start_codon:yes stop_codon:yes gene_type:complete